jgi:hypothetical protein
MEISGIDSLAEMKALIDEKTKRGVPIHRVIAFGNGAPLAPSPERGQVIEVPYWKSFISGIGSPVVFSEMWPLAHQLLAGSIVVRLEQTVESMVLLLRYDHV